VIVTNNDEWNAKLHLSSLCLSGWDNRTHQVHSRLETSQQQHLENVMRIATGVLNGHRQIHTSIEVDTNCYKCNL
jgi:hypothetical protein